MITSWTPKSHSKQARPAGTFFVEESNSVRQRDFFLMSQKKYCDFRPSTVSNQTQPYLAMIHSKLFVSGISFLVLALAAPLTTEAGRGGGGGGGGRGGGSFGGMSRGGFSRGGMSTGGARWGGGNWNRSGNWNGRNWSGNNWRGNNWHGNNWHGNNWHGNNVIFIGSFGFPWWWGWGGGFGWGYGYPYSGYPYGYGYYPYGYGGAYGAGYGYGNDGYYGNGYGDNRGYGNNGYGDASRSRVAELQRRLSRAGYYHGSVDGVLGPQTRRAIRAYEQDHDSAS